MNPVINPGSDICIVAAKDPKDKALEYAMLLLTLSAAAFIQTF